MNDYLVYIKELKSLSTDSVFRIARIERWLLKNQESYYKTKQISNLNHLYEIEGETIMLPDNFNNPIPKERFINAYDSLNKLTQLHRKEDYYKQEMAIYKDIKNDPLKLKQWIKKNEKSGAEDYVCFLTDYLDYDTNNNEYHLSVFFLGNEELNVFVDREDFKHTIGFLEVFNDLYWI